MSLSKPPTFLLDVATDPAARRVTLRLSLHGGPFVDAHEVALADHPAARWDALFDTRMHVWRHATKGAAAVLADLGEFLGEHVLGAELAGALAKGVASRTLLVRLPRDPEDTLAASFARVPWELAVAPGVEGTLGSRNVVVRATLEGSEPGEVASIAPGPGEAVRVLLVFTDAPGESPLAARLERERLLDLFFEEVMPSRNVEVDVLCHGVTRARIERQVRAKGGYHLVHWSGHGDVNALELAADEGDERTASQR